MKLTSAVLLLLVSVLAVAPASARCPRYRVAVLTDTSRDAHGLTGIVTRFQNGLGGENNGNHPGPIAKGFRQINWDAGSDVLPFDMPFNFFNVGDFTRGAIFRAKGREFRVSNSIHPKDDRFDSIIAKAQAQRFVRFSLDRLFAPFLSNRMATVFRIPGTNRRAVVSGFGVVFTDVVHPAVTNMRFFDKRGCLIAKVTVPTQPKGLSFAGIIVKNRKGRTISVISKVRITLGTVSLRGFSKKRRGDLVVMDDFLYGEPQKA